MLKALQARRLKCSKQGSNKGSKKGPKSRKQIAVRDRTELGRQGQEGGVMASRLSLNLLPVSYATEHCSQLLKVRRKALPTFKNNTQVKVRRIETNTRAYRTPSGHGHETVRKLVRRNQIERNQICLWFAFFCELLLLKTFIVLELLV